MEIMQNITGLVEVELTSANIPAVLERITQAGISVWEITPENELTVHMRLPRNQYRRLSGICKKHGTSLKLTARRGLYWMVKGMLSRPVLVLGVLTVIFVALFLPTRVLSVTVEGNEKIPSKLILEKARECGIGFWVSRREVRSERMKNALLEAVPELRWAGINTYGCRAVISVSEKALHEEKTENTSVSSLLACRDGVILSATATQGNLLCREGQAVKKGDVLISGYLDCGIAIRTVRAEGEIFALTNRDFTAIVPLDWSQREEGAAVRRKFSLIFGKKRINLWKGSGISDGSCGRMYEEYYVTLPGGFRLPVCIGVVYEMRAAAGEFVFPEEEAAQLLKDFSETCLNQQMVAGRITHTHLQIACDGSLCRLKGNYACEEMIGIIRHNEMGEYNGKNS